MIILSTPTQINTRASTFFPITISSSYSISSRNTTLHKMSTVSSNSAIKNTRSVSLPSRTHPTIQKVEEELQKLKSLKPEASSTEAICYNLSSLQNLYKSIDNLLNLPLITQSLANHDQKKWVDALLDKSIRILDINGIAKDLVSERKENVRDFQSSLRRRKGSVSAMEMDRASLNNYFSRRKKLKKVAIRALTNLKQIDQEIHTSTPDLDPHASTVIKVLQEVNSKGISTFQSVFNLLSLKSCSDQKTNRSWAFVSKLLVKKGRVHQLMESSNELENVDAVLKRLCGNDENEIGRIHILQKRLQNLENSLEGLENQLEVMFRCLIQSRTTLLNVFSC